MLFPGPGVTLAVKKDIKSLTSSFVSLINKTICFLYHNLHLDNM